MERKAKGLRVFTEKDLEEADESAVASAARDWARRAGPEARNRRARDA